ncbi:uncharacterized protein Dmoj_GI26622 [Drosophila mojavensis]|uniref:Uncharacterized protein n=1 Tax=Drosophila mojavensis TaxID=7230 RepID=A0A0Q9XIB1_DROMO|nr:uncharacterized protein Dmoj_GI26622 [Drosophila mojavensis]
MKFINIYLFTLCFIMGSLCWINAAPYYHSASVRRFEGNFFGEGVLRPGSDTGEGIFSELDAPNHSPPNVNQYNRYSYN